MFYVLGWFIQYIDPEEQERKEKTAKKQKMDKDDDERIQELIEKQAEKYIFIYSSDTLNFVISGWFS